MLNTKPRNKQKKSRQEINEASRELKRKRKRKGLPSGSRFNDVSQDKHQQNHQLQTDPRIGSKKPIALTKGSNTDDKTAIEIKTSVATEIKVLKEKLTEKEIKLAEKELATLESDPKLDNLLDMLEDSKELTGDQMAYLNSKLDRIDELMHLLGYDDDNFDDSLDNDEVDDDNEQPDKKEDIVGLLKRK